MQVKQFVLGEMNNRCYVVYNNDSKNAIIIDAGDKIEPLLKFVKTNKLNVCGVLLTHGHFDHAASGKYLQSLGYSIYISKYDADKLYTENNLSHIVNYNFKKFNPDVLIDEGKLNINEFVIEVINTPGHSKGSVCFIIDNFVFCGDTVFEHGYGRTDFYDGSSQQLRESVKKLKKYMNDKYQLFYGH